MSRGDGTAGPVDIIRDGFSSSYDVASMRFARRTYIACRQQGYGPGEAVPSEADLLESCPDEFNYRERKGFYSSGFLRGWWGEYLEVTAYGKNKFSYTLRQGELERHSDSLIHSYVMRSIKVLLRYAEIRNNSTTRSDVNLSFSRNRIIVWLCNELAYVDGHRSNADLLRRLQQIHFFLAQSTLRSNVRNYFPESTTDDGANGFPSTLNKVKREVQQMRDVIQSAIEMKSLGEMFESFGASLASASTNMACFLLYFSADGVICKVGGEAGTTFDFKTFYDHNVSNGRVVGERRTARGVYEPKLAASVLGQVIIYFYEMMQQAGRQKSFENRFLECAKSGRALDFKSMAAYVLDVDEESLPRKNYVWGEFYKNKYFPFVCADSTRVEGEGLPSDVMQLFGLLLEARKVAEQFKKAKSTANFMGDYNMVYNAHMHWGLQSLLVQWEALKSKINRLSSKLYGVRSMIVDDAPAAVTPFHSNSPIMIAEYNAASAAFNSATESLGNIQARLDQLRSRHYLEKQCEEAAAFVSNASASAKSLYEAGVLTREQYRQVERYKPIGISVVAHAVRDPLAAIPIAPVVPVATAIPDEGFSERKQEMVEVLASALTLVDTEVQHADALVVVPAAATGGIGSGAVLGAAEADVAFADLKQAFDDDDRLLNAHFRMFAGKHAVEYLAYFRSLPQHQHMVLLPLLAAAFQVGLAQTNDFNLRPPFHSEEYRVDLCDGGLLLVNVSKPKAEFIFFSEDKLLEHFGREDEKAADSAQAMYGRYAYAMRKSWRVHVVPGLSEQALTPAYAESLSGPGKRAEARYLILQAKRVWMMQQLIYIDQVMNQLAQVLRAVNDATVLPSLVDGQLQIDWSEVRAHCQAVPTNPLLANGINDITALMRKAEDHLRRVQHVYTTEYESCCHAWHVGASSKIVFWDTNRMLFDRMEQLEMQAQKDADVFSKKGQHATVDNMQAHKLMCYAPLTVKPMAAHAVVSRQAGKRFNVTIPDRQGSCDRRVRFARPKARDTATATGAQLPQQIFSGEAFTDLIKRVTANQQAYARYETEYRRNRRHTKLNYLVIGAGKAACMQAYCNELMLRLQSALALSGDKQAQAWRSVYDLLGGPAGEVNLDNREQRNAFLSSPPLTFNVRLCNEAGVFSGEDTSVNCLTHRHGRHGGISAANYWGMRGNASLPKSSAQFLTFVKSARLQCDRYLAKHNAQSQAAVSAST